VSGAEATFDQPGHFDDDLNGRVDEVVQRSGLPDLHLVLFPALIELLERHRIND